MQYIRVVPELKILTILPERTSKSIIVNEQPHPVQRPFWQVSLFHLPPKFTSTVKKYGNGNGVRELYYKPPYITTLAQFPSYEFSYMKTYVRV